MLEQLVSTTWSRGLVYLLASNSSVSQAEESVALLLASMDRKEQEIIDQSNLIRETY